MGKVHLVLLVITSITDQGAFQAYTAAATDTSLEDIQSIFMTNLFSVMLMCQAFAPLLISAKGKIVNIGSIVALVPFVLGSDISQPTFTLTN